jgi:hypothetical protein
LNKLALTAPSQTQKVCRKKFEIFLNFFLKDVRTDFDGFEQLFSRFLVESDQSSIDWQEIQPPPEGTVN